MQILQKDSQIEYTFSLVPDFKCNYHTPDIQKNFAKWGLKDQLQLLQFHFDQKFIKYKEKDFILQFFNDPRVQAAFKVCNSRGGFSTFNAEVKDVSFKELSKNTIRMDIFDKLYDQGIVNKNSDSIQKCFDIFLDDGMTVSDKLREMLMCPESENADIYSEEEKNEFIFHIFKRLCIGGAMNQYEDYVTEYLNTSKLLYKDFVRVVKNPNCAVPEIVSHIYQILNIDSYQGLWPRDSEYNFLYLIVDPTKNLVNVWYFAFIPIF